MPGRTSRPLTRPNQTSRPSSRRNLLWTRCRPSTSITARARSLIRYEAVMRSRRPSESGENTRGKTRTSVMTGAVVSTRIGFGRTMGRPFRSSWTRGRYTPSGTTRSRLSRPSQVYETRPAGSRRSRTSVRIERPSRFRMSNVTVSRRRRTIEMTATSRAHSQTGEKTRSTRVPVTGLRSSFRRSVTAKAAAVAPSRARTIRSCGHRATARTLVRLEVSDEHERFRILTAAARPVELRGRADGAFAPRMRVLAPLGLVVGERGDLPSDCGAHVDEPVRDEPVERRRRPLGARRRRVGEDAPDDLSWHRSRGHRNGVEEDAMVEVHVRMRRVHDLRPEVVDVLLDDAVDFDVRKRVEPHVRKVEMTVVGDAELRRGAHGLALFPGSGLRVARVLGGRAVCDDDDAYRVARVRMHGNRAAHPEHLVVRVRCKDQDPAHPSLAPTTSSPLVWISSSTSPPSPHATTGPSGPTSTIVPGGGASASSTARAAHTITFSSPRNVNAPGYGRVCA